MPDRFLVEDQVAVVDNVPGWTVAVTVLPHKPFGYVVVAVGVVVMIVIGHCAILYVQRNIVISSGTRRMDY